MTIGWVALQVRSKAEGRVAFSLRSKGYECFLPLLKTQPSDSSTQHCGSPLFPGYVFCYVNTVGQRQTSGLIVTTPGVLRFVSFGHGPALIDESEIAAIKQAVESDCRIGPHPHLTTGERVDVVGGPLRGVSGLLVRFRNGNRVVLSLNLLRRSMFVEVELADLIPAKAVLSIPRTSAA